VLPARRIARTVVMAAAFIATSFGAVAATPLIRTGSGNQVPGCVTPQRLMAFLKTRNSNLDPRFANIAALYRKHGEAWRVRWDYAFFQMALETNFLTYRQGNGRWGDVNPRQNNFAGLGTTGGGVPGDSYPDVSTGVLAQIQHLVVYSGERIAAPVGHRTRLKQDHILEASAAKQGRMTFADLTRRWAADRNYGRSIEWIASLYRNAYCRGSDRRADQPTPPQPVKRIATADNMPAAANLGGPEAASIASAPPVRTVWHRSNSANATSPTVDRSAKAAAAPPPRPALPTRKPEQSTVAASSPEQITPSAEPIAARVQSTAEPETPVERTARALDQNSERGSEVAAFAFAAGMQATRSTGEPRQARGCSILSASYGGKKALLVQSGSAPELRYTVLTVLDGFEKSMLESYLKSHARGGTSLGEFKDRDAALAKARQLCPGGATAAAEGASAG